VARRKTRAQVAPVTWRDGVHLTGTPIWCDARRRRDVCFVSSASRSPFILERVPTGRAGASRVGAGHGQLIATPETLALIGAKGQLGVPVHRPFTLGTLRLELIPSGRGLGGAALHVDAGDHSVLYAGEIRKAGVRAADAVVVASPVPDGVEPPPDAAERLVAWVRAHTAAVIGVESVIDGIEIASVLRDHGLVVSGTKSLRDAAARAGLDAIPAKGDVLVKVDGDRARLPAGHALQTLSARTWPFVASDKELLRWIGQTRARDVFVTGAGAERIASELGHGARVLGPPRQMSLFR
jgi:hypothetical protein